MRMYRSSDSDPVKVGEEAADEMLDVIFLKTMKNNFWFQINEICDYKMCRRFYVHQRRKP